MIERLFARQHKNFRRRRVPRHEDRSHTADVRLAIQPLEDRLALAIDLFQYPVAGVTSGASNYAILLMDDGTNGFLKKNATPSPSFTYATNSQFLDDPLTPDLEAITFGEQLAAAGPLESFYVTSGVRETYVGPAIPATSLGTSVFFVNGGDIDLGSSDGIVPGTFSGAIGVVDADGKSASALILASKPGNTWNLSFLRTSGDGALPTEGNINEFTGDVVLRGWTKAPLSVDLLPNNWGVYTGLPNDSKPLSFTLFPGQTVSQRFIVDLSRNESSISLNSPLDTTIPRANAGKAGDPAFFSAAPFGGQNIPLGNVGQVALYATSISLSVNVSSASLFTAGVLPWFTAAPVPTSDVVIERPVSAQTFQFLVEGSPADPGRLLIGDQGALSRSPTTPDTAAANTLDVQATHTDVVFAGIVNAAQQTYLLQSPLDARAYSLTTVSPTAGVQTGRIIGDTVGITLANDAGGDVDVRTTINNLRMTAASTPSAPVLPYAIRIQEADDLVIDAVPASERAIAITAGGKLTLTSSIQTTGDLALAAKNELRLSAPISSATGSIVMVSDSVTSNSTVTAGGIRGVTFTSLSATGDVDVNALVRAGGLVKQPVKASTVANIVRSGPQTIDGVALVAGDRVLVKNQAIPSENGIYVVAAGAWTRASDANLSGLFVPGFSVYVTDGTQRGGWAFANPTSPSLDTTGLLFVPVSATQAYAPVAAATTGNVPSLSGLLTIDNVPLLAGQRVLVKDQTNRRQNGIYVVATGDWQRAGDADTAAELRAGSYVFVQAGGTTNGSKGFVLDDDVVQVGVTQLTFSAFAVQPTRTNTYSPANVLRSAVAATTVNIDLTIPHATIDGQSLATDDLVLVKNQINAAQNGVYQRQASGVLTRWTGADSASELARGTTVYVTGGAVNAATSWTFNEADTVLGSVTAGNQVVNGLASTSRLAIGMLVTGPGIPSGTTIAGINSSTAIRLSKPATLTDPSAALAFMEVSAVVVGTTPIIFTPTGGTVVITAGESITSTATTPTSRLQGATALLSAGRPQSGSANLASTIKANTNVGRLSAASPATITVDNANAVDLVSVGTSSAGPVTVTAAGTLTALDVSATGKTGSPGTVALLSTLGNIVAAGVTSTLGDISLTAATGDVRVTSAGSYVANVTAQSGSVTITANESPGTTSGNIVIDGRLVADGAGSDIILKTSAGSLEFTSAAFVNAKDQLLIDTPQAQVTVDPLAQIAASRLNLTAQLGATKRPPPALGTYQSLSINRTDAGDIDYSTTSSLTVEGAVTKDGSIAFAAPDLTVVGAVQPNGTAKEISLQATAGDLAVDASLTASGSIRLKALTGKISSSAGVATPLISSPLSLVVEAETAALLTTKVTSLDAMLSGPGAVLEVTETDSLVIERVLLSAGGTADLEVGSPSAGGTATIKSIDVGATSGTLRLVANQNIVEDGTPTKVDIVANRAELTATTGKIDVDTEVNILLAQATQKNQTITVDDLGTGATKLELLSVATTNANIAVTAQRSILATSVTTGGSISLTTANATSDILVNNLSALGNTITLSAGGSILEATPDDPTADITATTVSLTATAGSINVHLDASAVAATANAVGTFIKIKDDNSLSIGSLTDGISGRAVTITVGGGLTQTKAILADSLAVATGTGSVTLDTAANDVDSLTVSGTGAVSFQDVDGLDIGTAGVSGEAITLKAGGTLTQTGKIAGTSLAITSSSGNVTLANKANDVGTLAVTLTGVTTGRAISYTDANALAIGVGGVGITGGDVAITTLAGTGITVNAPVVAGDTGAGDGNILLKATKGDINFASTLTAKGDTITLDASDGSIVRTPPLGSIDCQTLVWYAKTMPALTVFDIPPNAYTTVSPNLTGSGDIEIGPTAGTLTVAGASTADGNIKITGDGVIITGLVQAGGTGKAVTVTATTGSIEFQSAGQIVNALGSVSLNAATGAVTATNTGSKTSVAADSLKLTAKNTSLLTTTVGSISGTVTDGDLTLAESNGIVVGNLNGAAGKVISLFAGGPVTQAAGTAINAFLLAVTNTAGAVTLTNANNDVDWLTVNNGNRPVAFTDIDVLSIGGSGITGGNSGGGLGVEITATTIGVNAPITSGAAVAGNGDIRLVATTGDIWLSSTLTAQDDTITLDAGNGTIIQNAGAIDCKTLVWIANTAPTLFSTPPNNYTVVAPNLTGSGDIEIGPTAGALTVAGASTANGNIKITGDSVIITGLVQTNGVGKSVTVTANTGDIDFQSDGRIVNELGSVSLNAANGAITATNAATKTSVAADSLKLTAKNNSLLTTTVGLVSGTVAAGDLMLMESNGIVVGNLNGAAGKVISLFAGGPVTQTSGSGIKAFLLAVTNTAGDVVLTNPANDVDWLTISNDDRAVSFSDANDVAVGGNGITGGDITLHAGNIIGQTVAITGASLAVSSDTGILYLDNPANDVDVVTVNNGGRTVLFTDSDEVEVGAAGITGGIVVLSVGGDLTQVGEVLGFLLIVNASAGSVILTNPDNDVDWLSITNDDRAVSFTDANNVAIGDDGITGGDITLHAGKIIGQAVAIVGTSLAASSDADTIYLTNPANDVDVVTVNNGGRTVLFTDIDEVEIGAAGITGGVVVLSVGGDLTQVGEAIGFLLIVNASAGSVILTNPANDVDWLSITNDDRAVSFTDANNVAIGDNGITGGDITLHAGGIIGQTVAIVGTSLAASSDAGGIFLANAGNDVDELTVNNGNRPVTFTDGDDLVLGDLTGSTLDLRVGGTLAVAGSAITSGSTTITTTAGGGIDIGPIPDSLLQAGGTLDLQNVQGPIALRNNGRIVGSPILVVPGTVIQVGGSITTVDALNESITTINNLPVIANATYEILVAANISLTQTLTVSRPLLLRGTSQAITLFGSPTVTSGLLLNGSAGNSRISDLTFAGFAADAIRLTNNTGSAITGLRIRDSGFGLTVTGTSTGTVAQGNVFNRNATGVQLLSATGVLIGGSAAGQANTISNGQVGVFASGFCNGSQVIRNTITNTTTPYNTTQSRNLTVVQ